jgi:hypothetical protein
VAQAIRGRPAPRLERAQSRGLSVDANVTEMLRNATTEIVRRFGVIAIEDLNVPGVMVNGVLPAPSAIWVCSSFADSLNTRPQCKALVSCWRTSGIHRARLVAPANTSTAASRSQIGSGHVSVATAGKLSQSVG